MKNIQIFCDFDGTITKEDTLNKFLRLFADEKWLEVEDEWTSGKIGSRECISRQMNLVPRLSNKQIEEFIDSIPIDETFLDFIDYVKKEKIDFYIVSDGFDFFIENILKKNKIFDIKLFSNHLEIHDGKYVCSFPYSKSDCKTGAGMCKCDIVKKYKNVTSSMLYAGDGFSDFCVSYLADTVFAKGKLLEYCKGNENSFRGEKVTNLMCFNNFDEITGFLKGSKGEKDARYKV